MPTATIRLRPFGLADATTVAPWLDGPGIGLPRGRARSCWAERLIADPKVCAWVALRGGDRVAFVRLDIGPDRIAELTIAVASQRRRSGVGSAVLRQVLRQASSLRIRRVQAVVDPANGPALRFFGENAFDEVDSAGGGRMFVHWIHDVDLEVLEIEA